MATFQLGKDAKIYYGAEGDPLTGLTEMGNVTNVSLTLEASEADVTTRANSGWRATVATLKSCSVEFEMQFKPSDAGFTAIQTAFMNSGLIRLAPLTGDKSVAGNEGPMGDFSVTNFSRDEALEEAIKYKVTAKLAVYDSWVTTSGA